MNKFCHEFGYCVIKIKVPDLTPALEYRVSHKARWCLFKESSI